MRRRIHRPPGYHHPHRLLVFCFFTKVVHVVGEPVDLLDTQKKVDKLTRLQKDVDQRFGAHDAILRLKVRVLEVGVDGASDNQAVIVKVLIGVSGLLVGLLIEGSPSDRDFRRALFFALRDRLDREREQGSR